jgi:hypothetical protein
MRPVVVWVTKGGYVQYVADPEVEVVVIDYMDMEAGDLAPKLSDVHRTLLQKEAPYVLDDIEEYNQAAERDRTNQLLAPNLPGYVIWKQGVVHSRGYYVLPPYGNPYDTRDYLGYFPDGDTAMAAAREHLLRHPKAIPPQIGERVRFSPGWTLTSEYSLPLPIGTVIGTILESDDLGRYSIRADEGFVQWVDSREGRIVRVRSPLLK